MGPTDIHGKGYAHDEDYIMKEIGGMLKPACAHNFEVTPLY